MKISRKLVIELGLAVYRASLGMGSGTEAPMIAALSVLIDEHGGDSELFEQAAGWDDEERAKGRFLRERARRDWVGDTRA